MRVLCFLLMVLGAPVWSQAADSRLERLDTGEKLRRWQAVGRVDVAGSGHCTGTLIDTDLVLTAAHCVLDASEVSDPAQVRFSAGLRDGRYVAQRNVRKVIVHPDATDEDDLLHDAALLVLDRAIRLPGVKPFAVGATPWPGRPVAVVSYATGRLDAPSLQEICRSLGVNSGVSVLSCSVDFGASGSPVFQNGNVVGMIAAMTDIDGQRVALALDLPPLIRDLQAARVRGDGVGRSDNLRKVVRP